MDRRLLLICPVFVVLLSGCIGQTESAGGLVIEEFSTDFPTILPGEEALFNLKIKNTGSVDASIKSIQITGLDKENWKLKTDTCAQLTREKVNSGGTATCTFAFTSPDTRGLEMSFSPKIHLTYSYKTTTSALVSIGTLDEIRRISLQGGNLPYQTQSTSGGPISIGIQTASPVRVSGSSVDFPIRISVVGGSGTVCSGTCSENTWNKIKITMVSTLSSSNCPKDMELALFSGKRNSFVCDMRATASDTGAGLTQKRIEVTSEYDYIIESTTSIAIKKNTI